MKKRKLQDLLRDSQAREQKRKTDFHGKQSADVRNKKTIEKSNGQISKSDVYSTELTEKSHGPTGKSAQKLAPFFEFPIPHMYSELGYLLPTHYPTLYPFPYGLHSKILLVGEGNFSHANALADYYGKLYEETLSQTFASLQEKKIIDGFCENQELPQKLPLEFLTATCFESSLEVLCEKYPEARSNVENLQRRGATIIFGVDARLLHKDKRLIGRRQRYSRIVFQFPHLGAGIKDQDRNIEKHVQFMNYFLISSMYLFDTYKTTLTGKVEDYKTKMLAIAPEITFQAPKFYKKSVQDNPDVEDLDEEDETRYQTLNSNLETPEVHITLKVGEPYNSWKLNTLPKRMNIERIIFKDSFQFLKEKLVGYTHVNTIGHLNSTKVLLDSASAITPLLPDHLLGHSAKTYVFQYKSK